MGSTHSDNGASEGRVDWLAEQLERHSDLYYNKAEPEISDADFDAHVDTRFLKRNYVLLCSYTGFLYVIMIYHNDNV